MAKSYVGQTSTTAGAAAAQAEVRKKTHYEYLAGQYVFVPLAFETFGPWGQAAVELISEIARKITEHTGEKRAHEYLRQRISIEMQRGNAVCVLNTHPHSRGLDEIFSFLATKRTTTV